MKTEMVVRGMVEGSYDGRCSVTYERGGFRLPCSADVTVLRHGENGEVGGLEEWMVSWLRGEFTEGFPPEAMDGSADIVDRMIASRIANILNPEVSDE